MPDPQSDCKQSVNIDKFVENVSSLQNSSGSDKVSLKESRYIKQMLKQNAQIIKTLETNQKSLYNDKEQLRIQCMRLETEKDTLKSKLNSKKEKITELKAKLADDLKS